MSAPLEGVQVLDLSELLPGPFATQILTDLGATVTKIERPPHGDNARRMLPAMFDSVNRGKLSLAMNLKSDADKTKFHEMVRNADVVVEGYRPGVAARLGADYATLSQLNPRLIYASIAGYGATGHFRDVPGHDINYQAQAGVLAGAGAKAAADGTQPDITVPIADMAAALFTVNSILAALIQRERTGEGQFLDVSMTDATVALLGPRLGLLPKDSKDMLPQRPGYGLFPTRDGKVLAVGALEDHFFLNLMKLLKLDRYGGAEYATLPARLPHEKAINAAIRAILLADDSAIWVERLVAADIPVSIVADPRKLDEERIFKERDLIIRRGERQIVRYPVPMRGLPDPDRPIPAYDADRQSQ